MTKTTRAPVRSPRDGADALCALRAITRRGYAGIATRLRVSRQTVSAWANRRATPTIAHIQRMRRLLGVDERLWAEGRSGRDN